MKKNYSVMMDELLSYINNDVLDKCRVIMHESAEVAEIPDTVSITAAENGVNEKKKSGFQPLKKFIKAVLKSFVQDEKKPEIKTPLGRVKDILNECFIACNLFTMSSGNSGMPWQGANFGHLKNNKSFSVRIGVMAPPADDLKAKWPELDWDMPVPAIIPLDDSPGLFVFGPGQARAAAVDAVNSVALRILLSAEPGTININVLDPTGQNKDREPWLYWPGLTADDENKTEEKIEAIHEIIKSIEKTRLDKYPDLRAYNIWAEENKQSYEPYNILVAYDYPKGYTAEALKKLDSIIKKGKRCGIAVLIHCVNAHGQDEFAAMADKPVVIEHDSKAGFIWKNRKYSGCRLELDRLPDTENLKKIVMPVFRAFEIK
jgi:hypothetical protein